MIFKRYKYFFLLLFLSLVPLFDLFQRGLPITHDGQDHVIRAANFYQNLSEGNIILRWAPNVNYGFGHPVLMFFYPLPYYMASLFHFFGFSFIDSVKIIFGASFIASGATMYLWIRSFLGTNAAFAASMLYLFAPYRFIDLYVRGAIGEHVAFLFPPLIAYFLIKLFKRYSYWYLLGGSFSIAGLILSHNAVSLMFIPLLTLYMVYLLWQSKRRKLLVTCYLLLVTFGFALSAFFWIPAFFESKYTLVHIVTGGREYAKSFVDIKGLLYSPWSYGGATQFSVQVGFVQLATVVGGIIYLIGFTKRRGALFVFSVGLLGILTIAIFLMTQFSTFLWDTITLLHKFQFPWRFLTIVVFGTAVFGAVVLSLIQKQRQVIVLGLLVFFILMANKDYWQAKDYLVAKDSFFTGVQRTTTNDTGESSPIWSVRFMEEAPSAHIEAINGEIKIVQLKRLSTQHEYQIELSKTTRLRENTLYFPGWEVFVDGKNTAVEFQDPANRGLMTFFVEKGKHIVSIKFTETKLRFFADLISGFSLVIICFSSILKAKNIWPRFR